MKTKADAEFYQAQKQADAEAYKTKQNGDAESEQIAKVGKAKADAQKALAEALNAKGAASSLAAKIIDILPEMSKNNAEAIGHIDHLTVLNGAKGLQDVSAENLNSAMMMIKNTTGIDLADIIEKRANGQLTVDADDSAKKEVQKVMPQTPKTEPVKPKPVAPKIQATKPKVQAPKPKPKKTESQGDDEYLNW